MTLKIGYQGVEGAYSQQALREIVRRKLQGQDILEAPCESFSQIIDGILSEELDYGVIPVENSTTGIITRSLDLFIHKGLVAVESHLLEIRHRLMGTTEATFDDIRNVYSHPEALAQCRQFFRAYPQIQILPYIDTARACRFVKEENRKENAAIGSVQAAEIYGLKILKSEIQSEESNTTRFFLVKKSTDQEALVDEIVLNNKLHPKPGNIVFYAVLPHESGSLSKLLDLFHIFDINLLALNSRPIKDKPFEYGFFIEINLEGTRMEFRTLWDSLKLLCSEIQIIANVRV